MRRFCNPALKLTMQETQQPVIRFLVTNCFDLKLYCGICSMTNLLLMLQSIRIQEQGNQLQYILHAFLHLHYLLSSFECNACNTAK